MKTREQIVIEAFLQLIRNGEAKRRTVSIMTSGGSVLEKDFYKVEPSNKPYRP